MSKTNCLIGLAALLCMGTASAQIPVGGSVPPAAIAEVLKQLPPGAATNYNRLRIGTHLDLPSQLKTVHEGANYLLTPTGYRLVLPTATSRETQQILQRTLTAAARIGTFTTVETALLTIAGDDVRLVVDHQNKLVAFEPNH
ncbi:hypothetical protein [Eleftheria terrae]|uniref:hypothetical protein n=1 Tax=Eleftheria terrae TaxID=1597781 RepID=UPI00263A4463|nr:hypothetical protein [Eleftheria terrae]WKB50514.1 hypothetical protein N7L95_00260 [Eleftheria terrae]